VFVSLRARINTTINNNKEPLSACTKKKDSWPSTHSTDEYKKRTDIFLERKKNATDLADLLDVVSLADKGGGDEVNALLHAEDEILLVLFRDGRKSHRRACSHIAYEYVFKLYYILYIYYVRKCDRSAYVGHVPTYPRTPTVYMRACARTSYIYICMYSIFIFYLLFIYLYHIRVTDVAAHILCLL
jgi:hypothetical protein